MLAFLFLYCNRRNVNFTVGHDFDPILAYVVRVCNGILSVHEGKRNLQENIWKWELYYTRYP